MAFPTDVAGAADVVLVNGEGFDDERRKHNQIRARSRDIRVVREIITALAHDGSFEEQIWLMQPATYTLAFFDANGTYMTQVSLIDLEWLRGIGSDVRILDPNRLRQALTALELVSKHRSP